MQGHIYEHGLLGGRCSDIRIRAFGRMYHLHRLVLIQSGFFRAMLCGGYAEDLAAASAAATLSKDKTQRDTPAASSTAGSSSVRDAENDILDLHFDDPNISRAAFEYSIARLYGDGPKLVLPFWSTPSSSHPFSPALTMRLSQSSDLQLGNLLIDKHSHPATPRFLLSLLVTSIYLNIPSLTAQALTLVLCSMTPFTVTQYLRFARSCGIEGTELHRCAADEMLHDLDEWDWELEGPARTLEEIARPDPSSRGSTQSQRSPSFHDHLATVSADLNDEFSRKLHLASPSFGSRNQTTGHEDRHGAKKTAGLHEIEPSELAAPTNGNMTPEYQYGLPADKIGEACVCWFARWGFDIFELECSMERERIIEIETWIRMCREDRDVARLALLRDRLHTGDVDLLHTSMLPRGRMPEPDERMPSPRLRVWSYPSMPSAWVRAIISSDGFFVPSELHRYEFAKKVVEFRRKQKALIGVLDRLIDDWMREDEGRRDQNEADASDSTKKMGGAPKAGSSSAASSDAGDGFGFKAFRRTESVGGEDHLNTASTPLQEAWKDGVESTILSPSLDEDEAEYEELFSSGIYYSHMPFQALNKISADISPTIGRPYTPLNVLQAALWVSNELKTHILSSTSNLQHTAPTAFNEAEAGSEAASTGSTDSLGGIGELGVSSSIAQIRDIFESSITASNSQRRFSRGRSGTPMSMADDVDTSLGFNAASGLGGLAASPLTFGALGGGQTGLLNKKYYLVPSDDTVRFGDGLLSVIGSVIPSTSATPRGASSDDERGTVTAACTDEPLGPSGAAAIQIPHTLPITAVLHHDHSNVSHHRRDRSHYYGMANDVATGRQLGEYAYRHISPSSDVPRVPLGSTSLAFDDNNTWRSTAGESGAHSHDPNDEADGADAESIDSSGDSPERWSGYEPMRVGVEFFGIDKLQEKQRLYSPTFFYAGSVWNLYIQVAKKAKGIQLGIYLHRQSLMEQIPPPSAPTQLESELVSGLSTESSRPVESTGPRLSQRNANGSNTPRGRFEGQDAANSSRNSRPAQQSASRTSIFAAPTVDEAVAGEGDGSFFDTSFTSPVRAGGHGNAASQNAGSTLTLPSGRTATRVWGQTGGSPIRASVHDPFAATLAHANDAEGSLQSAEGSATATAAPLASLSSLADFGLGLMSQPSLASNYFGASSSASASAHGDTGASRASQPPSSQQPAQPQRPPIVSLYPGGPSVYQTCPLPSIPYRDPRKELRAYFSIHCPSPLGTALTKFSSGPDKFKNSQSWGWKSSSLLGTVHLEDGDLESGKSGVCYRFRCICTIGLV